MATDMDIDMDLDIDDGIDYTVPQTVTQPLSAIQPPTKNSDILSLELDSTQTSLHKVHLRGLDNLTTSDIKAFVSEYFDSEPFERIEWIDDTSANIVYGTPGVASKALAAFAQGDVDVTKLSLLQTAPARPFLAHPDARLEVRSAVVGDRKQAGARERSRFYLFNPELDRVERSRGDGGRRGGRRYRDRDDEGYRSRVYDETEERRRQDEEGFDVSLYDDDEATLNNRAAKQRLRRESRSSISSTEFVAERSSRVRFPQATGKELFPERVSRRNNGRLRSRSASPVRNSDGGDKMDEIRTENMRPSVRGHNGGLENRLKAQMIKTRLRDSILGSKELFPQKITGNHRRSDAFDAADATADLFADRMPVPFVDGTSDGVPMQRDLMSRISRPETSRLEDRISIYDTTDQSDFNIRGAAKYVPVTGFSIKGTAASSVPVKELFPARFGDNKGKELFSGKLEGRGSRRQRAEDMFY